MEIQELALKSILVQVRFPATPTFADARGALTKAIASRTGLGEWGVGADRVRVWNESNLSSVLLTAGEVRAEVHLVPDVTAARDALLPIIEYALDALEVEEVGFVGVRTYWAAAAESFEGVRDLVASAVTASGLADAVGSQVTDFVARYEFHRQDPKHSVVLTPGIPSQLPQDLPPSVRDDFPPAFLFLDVDRVYSDAAMSPEVALRRLEEGFVKNPARAAAVAQVIVPGLATTGVSKVG